MINMDIRTPYTTPYKTINSSVYCPIKIHFKDNTVEYEV